MLVRKMKNPETYLLADYFYKALYVPKGEPPFPKAILNEPHLQKYFTNIDLEKDLCLVSEVNGQIVGAIWGRYFTQDNQGYGFIQENYMEITLAVDEGYRNQKIGSMLIEAFIVVAKNIGIKGLSLSVSYGNHAKYLYEKVDFKLVAERETDILMVKELNDSTDSE